MAGWINDYKLDYSPVVNALNSRLKDKAEQRALFLNILEKGGNLIGQGIDAKLRDDAYEEARELAKAKDAKMKSEDVMEQVKQGNTSLQDALPYLMGTDINFLIGGNRNAKL